MGGPDGLSLLELVDPMPECLETHQRHDADHQPGQREDRQADHHQDEDHLHEPPTFRNNPPAGRSKVASARTNRPYDHSPYFSLDFVERGGRLRALRHTEGFY